MRACVHNAGVVHPLTRERGARRGGCALALALGLAAAAPASAHVEPSVDRNNRYLKVSPMGDRVRLAYTVLFGEKPGAAMRRRLDRDRDGQVSAAEADVLGRELAASLAPTLTIAVDGAPVVWSWARVDVGLGTPAVAAGSLSVDLIAWICTPAGGAHRLALRDDHVLPEAGDSELRIEEGPGITLGARTLGGEPLDGLDASWTGTGGPIATGFELAYTAGPAATRPKDGRCTLAPPRASRPWLLPTLLLAALAVLLFFVLLRRRR